MKIKGYALLLFQLCCATLPAWAQYQVHFDQARYQITRGQSFQVQVLVDPVPSNGLSSFGVVVNFPGGNANVTSVSSVLVPVDLDFNGVRGAGAIKAVGTGFAATKGTVNFAPTPAPVYRAGLLATITVQDLGIGPYTLALSPFNTLGPTEEIFVDGIGRVLDPQITFGSATVEYRTNSEQAAYAIFAGEPRQSAKSGVLYFKGTRNKVTGSIHSNSGIKVGGSHHIFRNGVVEYVTAIQPPPDFGGKVTFENSSLARSTNKPYPVNYVLRDYAPGGRAALAAQSVGKYYRIHSRRTDLSSYVHHGMLREGLYYVEGSVDLDNDCIRQGHVTIVATGKIEFNLDDALFESFADNLLTFTSENDCDSPAIKLSARNNRWQGIVFAPNGLIEVHGKNQSNEWSDNDHDHDDHGNDDHGNNDHGNGDHGNDDHGNDDHGNGRGSNDRDDHDQVGNDRHGNDWHDNDRHDDRNWRTSNTTLLGALIGKRVRVNAKNLQITALSPTNQTGQRLVSPLRCFTQNGEFNLSFQAAAGMTYAVEYTDSLVNPDWRLWCILEGNGNQVTIKPPVGEAPQRFYRLRLQ